MPTFNRKRIWRSDTTSGRQRIRRLFMPANRRQWIGRS
jgi:hypothetical protein